MIPKNDKKFQLVSLINDDCVLYEANSRAACARFAKRTYGTSALLTAIRRTPLCDIFKQRLNEPRGELGVTSTLETTNEDADELAALVALMSPNARVVVRRAENRGPGSLAVAKDLAHRGF